MPEKDRLPVRQARSRLFDTIDATPNLDWLLVTKRPENIRNMWPGGYLMGGGAPPMLCRRPNVWLLTSVEDQETADRRVPELLKCRDLAPVLGLSIEPLLGPIDLKRIPAPICDTLDVLNGERIDGGTGCICDGFDPIDWVIVGGESGPHARPMDPRWVVSLRDQCIGAGVPFFFKQWGEFRTTTLDEAEDGDPRIVAVGEDNWPMTRVGKKEAGRLLDGREWSEFPNLRAIA